MGLKVNILGDIHKIEDVQTFSKGFTKQTLIIKDYGEYPEYYAVEFLKDNIQKLDGYKVGDAVECGAFLGGREWTNNDGVDRYFLGLKATYLGKPKAVSNSPAAFPTQDDYEETGGDLPF